MTWEDLHSDLDEMFEELAQSRLDRLAEALERWGAWTRAARREAGRLTQVRLRADPERYAPVRAYRTEWTRRRRAELRAERAKTDALYRRHLRRKEEP